MRARNICKFHSSDLVESLNIRCFVRESNPVALREGTALRSHRIFLVIAGEGQAVFDGGGVPVTKGSLLFGFEGERVSFTEKSPLDILYIDFYGTRADALLHRFDIHKNARIYMGYEQLEPFWLESLSRASEDTVDLAGESMLLYTFSRMHHPNAQHTKLLREILDITEFSFSEPSLSLSTIASKVGYNPKYLSRLFKEKMGIGYAQYLRNLRIKHAITLFENGIDSVKNVAFLSGFSDALYFSSVFKAEVGVSPLEYKKRRESES